MLGGWGEHCRSGFPRKDPTYLFGLEKEGRAHDPHTPVLINLRIEELPPAPARRITVRLSACPAKVVLQPRGTECDNWVWNDGLLQVHVPGFDIHQMVVIQ